MWYVSSKLKHRDMWKDSNIPTTSTWLNSGNVVGKDNLAAMWQRYMEEIDKSNGLVLYVEPGETLKGAMIEVGALLSRGKPVYLIFDGNIALLEAMVGTWIYHKNVIIVPDLESFRVAIAGK